MTFNLPNTGTTINQPTVFGAGLNQAPARKRDTAVVCPSTHPG